MRCPSCGHCHFKSTETQVAAHYNGVAVVVDSVPSLVCGLCGDVSYGDGVTQAVQELIEAVSHSAESAARVTFARA